MTNDVREREEILFDVCKNVYKELERLSNQDEFRFVIMFCEMKENEKRKKEYEILVPIVGGLK